MNKFAYLWWVLGLALATALVLFFIYRAGYEAGKNKVTVDIQNNSIKDMNDAIKKSDSIEKEIHALDHADINQRLIDNGWMRQDND